MRFIGVYGIAVWDLWGNLWGWLWDDLAMLSYGISPMGSMGTYVLAVWHLWDSYRSMVLRCGTYGMIYGDLKC